MGVHATDALVISQVVLSLVLPVPMIALLVLIRRPAVMAGFAIGRPVQVLAACGDRCRAGAECDPAVAKFRRIRQTVELVNE